MFTRTVLMSAAICCFMRKLFKFRLLLVLSLEVVALPNRVEAGTHSLCFFAEFQD